MSLCFHRSTLCSFRTAMYHCLLTEFQSTVFAHLPGMVRLVIFIPHHMAVKGGLPCCRLHRLQQDVDIIREQTTVTTALQWQTFAQGVVLGAGASAAAAWLMWRARFRQ